MFKKIWSFAKSLFTSADEPKVERSWGRIAINVITMPVRFCGRVIVGVAIGGAVVVTAGLGLVAALASWIPVAGQLVAFGLGLAGAVINGALALVGLLGYGLSRLGAYPSTTDLSEAWSALCQGWSEMRQGLRSEMGDIWDGPMDAEFSVC